jgi:hypothetical protein
MASLSDWSMPCPGSSPLNGRTGSGVGADRGWGVWSLVNAVVVGVARCREGHCRHFVTDRPLAPTILTRRPRHTHCGPENSATYVGVRPGAGVGMRIALHAR